MEADEGVRWIETSRAMYKAICDEHANDLTVFATRTEVDGPIFGSGRRYILTEWGLKGAAHPLIRSERNGEEWTYYIAHILKEAEDGE